MFESSPDLSVNTVAEIVRLALAPVFLLSGIGAFLNVLASRLSRIVDRSRRDRTAASVEPRRRARPLDRGPEGARPAHVADQLGDGLSVTSAILTCLVVILLFAANLSGIVSATEIAWLFMGSMVAIGAAFAVFLVETTVAARAVRVRSELLQHRAEDS